jgi:branched-chain amino acid aminotransferase
MININGAIYSNYNTIPSSFIKSFIVNPVFDFKLRWEVNKILFWEEHYFMMMAQLRRLRLVIPMDFTLDFFIKEIKKLINIKNEKYLIIHLKFANEFKPNFNNFEPNLITAIFTSKSKSFIHDDFSSINEMSLFKDYNLTDQEFGSISYLQKDIKRIASIESFENNCDDNIILNNKKNVIGSVLGNVFLLHEGRIICPPSSIGRESIVLSDLFIEYLKNNNISFSYESFGVFELQVADELSVLSIDNGISPVCKYRKKTYQTKRLPEVFKSFIKTSLG